jgi:hypothetical protein
MGQPSGGAGGVLIDVCINTISAELIREHTDPVLAFRGVVAIAKE